MNTFNKITFKKIRYEDLNGKQQENFNFQKVSAILADYGYATIRLTDDYKGADFIAIHIDGKTFLKVQLKGRLSFNKKYIGKDIWICFPHSSNWFLYPHDTLLEQQARISNLKNTRAWRESGDVSNPRPSRNTMKLLEKYKLE